MAKRTHNEARKAVKTVARKARAGRSAYVMDPECLALLENFRLMDDTFIKFDGSFVKNDGKFNPFIRTLNTLSP